MHAAIIILAICLALALTGILADVIAPAHPHMLDLIYTILDQIM